LIELTPKTVLARWYWHYFQQNNWRFLNRSATSGLNEKDFTTWDLPKLFGKIGALFEEIFNEEKALQRSPCRPSPSFCLPGISPATLLPLPGRP
jgi:hypothetical protein